MKSGSDHWSLIKLYLAAAVAGSLAGVLSAAFRACLLGASWSRVWMVTRLQHWPAIGWVVPVVAAAIAVVIARWLVVLVPAAAGSGVQRVEASVRAHIEPETLTVVVPKFVGGVLAIGSGMVLGREGPTVQMATAIGSKLSRLLGMNHDDQGIMQASLAGAGLAAAFNAPLGGAIFVIEELTKTVRLRLITATLIATATSVAVMRELLGDLPDFDVPALAPGTAWGLASFVVLGVLLGLLGAYYSRLVVWLLDAFERLSQIPLMVRAGFVGAVIGLIGWFAPTVVGGGDNLTQELLHTALPISSVAGVVVLRWFLGPLSYSVGAPGGLFAPLLVLGAGCGALFGAAADWVAPGLAPSPTAFTLVGMAVFFTAIVRAPLTGIALVAEMTATTSLLVPMLIACSTTVITTTMIGSEPIYDTLRHRMLRQRRHQSS